MHSMTSVSEPALRGRGGRVLWRACGIGVCAALGAGALHFAGHHWTAPIGERLATVTKTITVAQPVTSLTVRLPSTAVQVIARPGKGVKVTSTVSYDPLYGGPPPGVRRALSGGRLTLSCAGGDGCSDSTTVIVPPDVAVTVLSAGGPVNVDGLHGPLTAMTAGGLSVSDLTGPLYADIEGGALTARGLSSQTVIVSSVGDETRIGFARPPRTVVVSSYGSAITLAVPGGPYAVSTGLGDAGNTDAPVRVGIPTSLGAPRTLTLDAQGAPVTVEPAG
jgi:hypothetical protein